MNRLTQLSDSASLAVTYSYDVSSKLTTRNLPNGVATTYEYDGIDRLTRLRDAKAATTIADKQYQYNNAGQITQLSDLGGVHAYDSDAVDRLTSASYPNTPTESYSYDAVGNRTSSHLSAAYTHQSFNRLTSTASATYAYDNNGNRVTKVDAGGTTQYAWDFENQLKQVTLPTGDVATYKYDALGRRIERSRITPPSITSTTRYIYDGSDVIRDTDANGATTADYLNGPGIDNKVRQTVNGAAHYFLNDQLGSTSALTDGTGNVVEQQQYDSFGNSTGSALTRYDYTGRERDPQTGLMFYRARWYDPQLGRFLSQDPIGFEGGDIHLYSYVANNPMNDSDPLGLQGRAGSRGRGNYHPPFRVRCNPSQDCATLARNMTEIARAIASAYLLDQELGFPRHQPPHSSDIPDWANAFARGKRIYDRKCKDCGPPARLTQSVTLRPPADDYSPHWTSSECRRGPHVKWRDFGKRYCTAA